MKRHLKHLLIALGLAGTTVFATSPASADNVSYQGELQQGGTPLTDTCDFRFTLWDASAGGNQIGLTVTKLNVPVVEGRFTTSMDFGANAFNGADRFLEIEVRCPAGSGNYVLLTPRQPMLPAPYALKSLGNTMSWMDGAGEVSTTDRVGIGGTGFQLLHIQGDAGTLPMIALDSSSAPAGSQAVGLGLEPNSGDFRLTRLDDSGSTVFRTDFVVEASSGHVGIGTTNPIAPLNVRNSGGTASRFTSGEAGTAIIAEVFGGSGNGRAASLYGISSVDLLRVHNDGTGPAAYFNGFVGVNRTTTISGAEMFGIRSPLAGTSYGGMYIDTAAAEGRPFYGFATGGSGRAWIYYDGSTDQMRFYAAGNRMVVNQSDGNVGIGTVDPQERLHIVGGTDTELAAGGFLVTGSTSSTNISMDNNEIQARNNGGAGPLYLNHSGGHVYVGQNSGGTTRLVTPVIQITGGSDFSEMFDVGGDVTVEPGMVVVIDPDNPGRLVPSTSAYDCKVAGIVSGAGGVATGMTMGHDGTIADGEHPVALSGRVYCLVDARTHAVEPGDMLTTAALAGHAMKATDRDRAHGAVIGKAMTPLAEGEVGLVLVLVNLQ